MAISGGIAEGKSTVLQWLREDGFSICSSDEIARQLFGREYVRERLAQIAGLPAGFAPTELRSKMLDDSQVRRAVNRYLHPLIGAVSADSTAHFYEVPLLIEACLYDAYDQVWIVSCGAPEQRKRLMDRYHDESMATRLLSVQVASAVRTPFADAILRTNQPLGRVREELGAIVRELRIRFLCSGQ